MNGSGMSKVKRSTYELKKLSEWWFDLSKLSIGSLVLKLFEPSDRAFGATSAFTVLLGLTFFIVCANFGRNLARRVEE